MLVGVFSNIKLNFDFKPRVDNAVFHLHYRYTYSLFMASVLLTTLYDWIGNSIECLIDSGSGQLQAMVDSWCFIMGTFTVNKHRGAEVGAAVPFPGVGPHTEDDDVTVHSYYQWVPFVLFFQGALFYLPHWCWKSLEGGLIKNIIMDLSLKDFLGNNLKTFENRSERYEILAKYIKRHLRTNRFWAAKFFVCEAANLLVSVVVFVSINSFLGGEFTTYGTEVFQFLNMDPENRTDPMYEVFPRMAKCTFQKFGPSGTVEVVDVMCLLPTNIVNEKIYVLLWLWLIILMAITSIWLIFRILTILMPGVQRQLIKSRAPRTLPSDIQRVLDQASLSDWFLLYNLGKNMDRNLYSEFLSFLANEIKRDHDDISESLPLRANNYKH